MNEVIPNLPEKPDGKPVVMVDLVDAIKVVLSQWACRKYAVDPVKDGKTGVHVMYNTWHPNLLKFIFRTVDDLEVMIDYDIDQTSQEYLRNLVDGIKNYLFERRQYRATERIILNTKNLKVAPNDPR